jgi:acetoacetyl-CoA synthetase
MVRKGDLLWTPSEAFKARSGVTRFMDWLSGHGHRFATYDELWAWSVRDVPAFWEAVWNYFGVQSTAPYECVLRDPTMPGAQWFPGARVNYVRHLMSASPDEKVAVFAAGERIPLHSISWGELRQRVYTCATSLRELGVKPGERVAAYVANVPDSLVAFLATASIGAVWSSCSPDFGAATVIDRFRQISPALLFATDGYVYGGREFDRRSEVRKLVEALPSLRQVVQMPGLQMNFSPVTADAHAWETLFERAPVTAGQFAYEDTAFDHPLWVAYSSGTTGLPKAFVHGHGGILLEALKFTHFHFNLQPESCMFFYTTTGWVMWNILFSSLITGASIVLYDGNPLVPDSNVLWRLAQDAGVTMFGTSPSFLAQQMATGAVPRERNDLSRIDSMLVAGSPVMPHHMEWCYRNVQEDLWLTSQSGGTDVATAFVGSTPLLPVHAGEIQTRCLGVDVCALDDAGRVVVDEVGEMVVRQPMPSMPLYLWNDPHHRRYRESYFDVYPGLWRHGDYLTINSRGGCHISGRSDATLNRHGVRIGTAEIYRVVEAIPGVRDSLIVNLDLPGGGFFMPLFVVLQEGSRLDESLQANIRQALRDQCSPRHVPDRIYQVDSVPTTLTGKKLEVPVRKILLGRAADEVASRDALANPGSLDFFVEYAARQDDYALRERSALSSTSS